MAGNSAASCLPGAINIGAEIPAGNINSWSIERHAWGSNCKHRCSRVDAVSSTQVPADMIRNFSFTGHIVCHCLQLARLPRPHVFFVTICTVHASPI
jgi:hypothetical protein